MINAFLLFPFLASAHIRINNTIFRLSKDLYFLSV